MGGEGGGRKPEQPEKFPYEHVSQSFVRETTSEP